MTDIDAAPIEEELRAAFDAGRLHDLTASFLAAHSDEILRFLAAYLGTADAAREVYGVFCEAFWKGLPRFEWRCSLRAWAYTLARHAAIRHGANQLHVPRRAARWVATCPPHECASARTSTAPYLRSDVKTRMRELRARLRPDDQALIILRVDRGLSWRELCAVLNADRGWDAKSEARLRKRFQLLKTRLRGMAVREGIISS